MFNIRLACELIKVEKPVKFKIRKRYNKKGTVADHVAFMVNGNVVEHVITINMGNVVKDASEGERDVDTLIVHELIHAWQAEKGYKDNHGKSFQRKVKKVAGILGMPRLYLSMSDLP